MSMSGDAMGCSHVMLTVKLARLLFLRSSPWFLRERLLAVLVNFTSQEKLISLGKIHAFHLACAVHVMEHLTSLESTQEARVALSCGPRNSQCSR